MNRYSKRFSKKFILLSIAIFFIGVFSSAAISYAAKEQEIRTDEARREAMYSQILDGANTKPSVLNVDYSKKLSSGSPLVFGGAQNPALDQPDAWDEIANVGVTMARVDFGLHWMLKATNLDHYKNNIGEIQNVDNWDTINMNKAKSKLAKSQEKGLKTIGIVDYTPTWLSSDNTEFGVPKDWAVFEDIVKKSYSFYRDNLDYVEIWNEPNYERFLSVQNSGMTRKEAYFKIYYHASKAIREVDKEKNDGKTIPIGGPVGYNPTDTTSLEAILENEETRSRIDFISYHNYKIDEPSWSTYKEKLNEYGLQNLPIFITEWNLDMDNKINSPLKTSDPAILYTGNKLIEFLKMGVAGANYYSLLPINESNDDRYIEYMGFYRWKNGSAELLPQSKAWRLMSIKMGLGKGNSSIYNIKSDLGSINGLGFINSFGQHGVILLNPSESSILSKFTLNNTDIKHYAKVKTYYASSEYDASNPTYDGTIKAKDGTIDLAIYIPKETIVGVIFEEENEWYDFINLPY